MTASDVTRFVNSRSMVAVAGVLLLVAARIAFQNHEVTYFVFDRGTIFKSANLWISDTWLTMAVNTALILATALLWMLVIQFFNPFRALTTLPASFFLLMMLSVPEIVDQLFTGSVLVAIMPLCLALLWSSFGDTTRLRHIFLLFALLSALSMTQYCYVVYIPVFLVGCVQMKIFSLRTITACMIGLITPWWIVFGLGIADPDSFHWPAAAGFFNSDDVDGTVNVVMVTLITSGLMITAWIANLMNVVALNANLRSYNGSISLISLVTLIAMLADFNNAVAYLPTLMLMASYQLAFMFEKSTDKRRFIPILAIMAVYAAVYVLRILV